MEQDTNQVLRFWERATGQEIRKWKKFAEAATAFAFSTDGQILALGSWRETTNSGVVRLWNLTTGEEVRQLESPGSGIQGLVFSPDGKQLVVVGGSQMLHLWEVVSGKKVGQYQNPQFSQINGICFSPDGKSVAWGSGDGKVRLWEEATGWRVRELVGQHDRASEPQTPYGAIQVAYSKDGKSLASVGCDRWARFWDVGTGKETRKFEMPGGVLTTAAFSPEGQVAATAGHGLTIRLWDLIQGKEIAPGAGHRDSVLTLRPSPGTAEHWLRGAWIERSGSGTLPRTRKPGGCPDTRAG